MAQSKKFAFATFKLLLVICAQHALCTGIGEETSARLLEDVVSRLIGKEAALSDSPDLFQHVQGFLERFPAGISGEVGQQFAAAGSPKGLLQQLRHVHSVADRSELGQRSMLGSTFFEDGLKLLEDFGLWNPPDPESVNLEEAVKNVAVQQNVGTRAWQNVSALCLNNTLQFFQDLGAGVPYAGQIWLSNGDVPAIESQFTYNNVDLGIVEQCQAVTRWNPDAPFETTYCRLQILADVFDGFYPTVGLCVPANCSISDLEELFGIIPAFKPYFGFDCIVDYPWNGGAIATVCLLCLFLLLVVVGTTYHLIVNARIEANAAKKGKTPEQKDKPHMNGYSKENNELHSGSNGTVMVEMKKHPDDTELAAHDNKGFDGMEEGIKGSQETTANAVNEHAPNTSKKKLAKLNKGLVDTALRGFSSIHNGSKIMNTEPVAGSLEVLNGIRVISMWWIILGHTISYMFGYYSNVRYALEQLSYSFLFIVVVNAEVAVDTFFFLSGLLLTYLTLKHLKKANGKISWGLFYLHRFVRITPAYMMAMAIWASLAIHFGQGPGKIPFFEEIASNCRERWWTHPLYINNLYPFPGDLDKSCIGWTWYLANDMQFFIISPIIIYLLYKYPKWGMGLIVALAFASFGVTAYLAAYYGDPVGLLLAYNNNTVVVYDNPNADVIYGKPYCRIPAYLVGMVTGYIFYKLKGRPFKMSKCFNLTMWFISTGVALAIVYGTYRNQGESIPQYAAVLYTVFHRPAFVIAVAWVVFSCTVGYGGPVNTLLSWGFWAPLSRLTFGAYLLHPIIMFTIYSSSNTQYHFSYMQFTTMFLANLIFAYGAAFLLAIGVEGPFMGLEKALLGRGARPKK